MFDDTNPRPDLSTRLMKSQLPVSRRHRSRNTHAPRIDVSAWAKQNYPALSERAIQRLSNHENAIRVLVLIDANHGTTYPDLFRALDITERAIREITRLLDDLGLIDRVRSGRSTFLEPASRDVELVIKHIIETLRPTLTQLVDGATSAKNTVTNTVQAASKTIREKTTDTADHIKNSIPPVSSRYLGRGRRGDYPDG